MKVLVIPDVHQTAKGIQYAKEHIDEVDKVVFLGDYVDNWDSKEYWVSTENNPIHIIEELAKFNDKVDLLIGNHDLAYLSPGVYAAYCSGHQTNHHIEIKYAFKSNILSRLKVAVEYDGVVFSHGGIGKMFFDRFVKQESLYGFEVNKTNFVERLNSAFEESIGTEDPSKMRIKCRHYFLDHYGYNPYGDDCSEGPLWIRPSALCDLPSEFNIQVVGHTEFRTKTPIVFGNDKIKLICVDTPDHDLFYVVDTENIPEIINRV